MRRKPAGPSSNVSASHLCASPPRGWRGCRQSFLGWRWRTSLTSRGAESRSSECAISGGPNALRAPVSPSTFPTGTFRRGRSQPWTPALSLPMPCPILCSPVRLPPAAAPLTGGKTSAWNHRNKTNLSFPRCPKLQKLQSTYWFAEVFWGFRALKSAATRSQPGWPAVGSGSRRRTCLILVVSVPPCRGRCALPGAPGGHRDWDCTGNPSKRRRGRQPLRAVLGAPGACLPL